MAKTKVEIKAKKRQATGKKNKKVRAAGLVPAVVYGRKFKATSVALDLKEYNKKVLCSDAGQNLIFSLKVADDAKAATIPVITQHIQRNPLDDQIIHLDLMNVIMDEAIKTKVPVELTGLPIGVKEEGGVLVHGLREIEVKCLPGDIPDKFEVDVAGLTINQSLHVSDLRVSGKVEVLADPGEMIANVSPPTKEEEVVTPTPEEALAAAGVIEGEAAVAAEEVKEKAAPGTAPAEKEKEKEKAPAKAPAAKPTGGEKKPK